MNGDDKFMQKLNDLKARLEKLENDEYMLQMKDHWSDSDYYLSREHLEEAKTLEKEIAELEKEEE